MAITYDQPVQVTDPEKIRALPWSLAAGPLNAIFGVWTFGGSFFLLFLNEVRLPKAQIGLLLSLFPFCGLVAPGFAHIAAKIGRKRVFLAGYGIRKFVMAGLLLLPFVIAAGGRTAGLIYLCAVVGVFAILRALAETAYYPWLQEFIPNNLRGKYSGVAGVLTTSAQVLAVLIAGWEIGAGAALPRFLLLIGAGCIFGILGVVAMVFVPGGSSLPAEDAATHGANLMEALRDRNLLAYLGGLGAITLGGSFLTCFLPLFVKEQLRVHAGTVIMLDTAVMLGSGISSVAWGWAADRVGSRPVQLSAIVLALLIPIGWMLLPRQTTHALTWCILLYTAYGISGGGIGVSTLRLFFNGVVPQDKTTAYNAIYYAWIGVMGGLAPLLAGGILSAKWHFQYGPFATDPYALLFLMCLLLTACAWLLFMRVEPDDRFTTRAVMRKMMEKALPRQSED